MDSIYDLSFLDEDFLIDLQMQRSREIFAKIASLDIDENPIEYIEGKITGGSINIDGSSAVRRTCSLTMVSENININDFYWGLKTKIKVFIGLKNEINKNYPDIIWFPQGIYVLSSFNTSLNTSGTTISLSGKDKMCLLNGDLSGNIFASVDFGTEETYTEVFEPITISKNNFKANTYYSTPSKDSSFIEANQLENSDTIQAYEKNLQYVIKKIPLEKIIREGVHAFAIEPYHNIFIHDLDNYGLEQLTYRGEDCVYALRMTETGHFTQLIRKGYSSLDNLIDNNFIFDSLTSDIMIDISPTQIYSQNRVFSLNQPISGEYNTYTVAKIEYGEDIGYRLTDLIYNGDLITSLGESFSSVLDKIKTMLGDFEYFYDIDGRFVFQRKKHYINTYFSNLKNSEDETYVSYAAGEKKCVFNFEDSKLISAFQNSPVLNNVKNDYAIWGKRKSVSGAEIAIHMRYAIDKKPKYYKALNKEIYITDQYIPTEEEYAEASTYGHNFHEVDWREIIYQMALDYFAAQGGKVEIQPDGGGEKYLLQVDNFLYEVAANNQYFFPDGYTKYEQYYTDIQGFWRQLYNPNPTISYNIMGGEYVYEAQDVNENNGYYRLVQVYKESSIDLDSFIVNFYFKDYDELYKFIASDDMLYQSLRLNSNKNSLFNDLSSEDQNILQQYFSQYVNDSRAYWSTMVYENPEMLNFWIDFLDSISELTEFSVPVIGTRSKTINDDKVTAIFYRDIPDVILSTIGPDENGEWIDITQHRSEIQANSGYTFVFLPQGMEQLFSVSYRGKSAKDKLDQLLYDNAYCIENITVTSLPLYHLQPNNRIYVKDKKTNINGEYLINKLTLSLSYDGTMSITATKAPERLY